MPSSYRIVDHHGRLSPDPSTLDASKRLGSQSSESSGAQIQIVCLAAHTFINDLNHDALSAVANLDHLATVGVAVGLRAHELPRKSDDHFRVGVGPAAGTETDVVVSQITRVCTAGKLRLIGRDGWSSCNERGECQDGGHEGGDLELHFE
jgi:hypothetical protein